MGAHKPLKLRMLQSFTPASAKVVAMQEVKTFFEALGGLPGGTKTDEFRRLVRSTTKNWAPVAAKANIEKQ